MSCARRTAAALSLIVCAAAIGIVSQAPALAAPRSPKSVASFVTRSLSHAVARTAQARAVMTYLVVPGDTLSLIASRFGTTWETLWQANPQIANPNLIYPGQKIQIGGAPASSSGATTTAAKESCDGDGDGDDVGCPAAPAAADPPAAPAAQPATQTASTGYSAPPGSFQACVIQAESGGNASAVNPSSGAGGLYGFLPSTWQGLGFPGLPENAPVSEQNAAFAKEYAQSGTSAWSAYDGC